MDYLEPVVFGPPSRHASNVARALLKAYYLQDERERYLLRGEYDRAATASERALARMADVYEVEFPDVDAPQAREAGREFVYALFLQDEIENWPQIRESSDDDRLGDVLTSDVKRTYDSSVMTDARWPTVYENLLTVCDRAGIDDLYAELQTRFWRLHGLSDENWEPVALVAHGCKLRAMVPDPSADDVESLGAYFVAGVKAHDEWEHEEANADLDGLVDVVARYYQRIFELRSADERT